MPIYAGLLNAWFWEGIWRWDTTEWVLEGSDMNYQSYSPVAPCGSFNPLGMAPFFYSSPPYRIYEVWKYGTTWVRCYSERNW